MPLLSSPSTVFIHRPPPFSSTAATTVFLLRRRFAAASLSSGEPFPKKPSPRKNLFKAKESINDASLFLPNSAAGDPPELLPTQAIGFVAAAQANFMRVIVDSAGGSPENPNSRIGTELLCVVRALLKKTNRRVLVGDRVLVASVDWVDGRGMIEDVFHRDSEVADPPVANVDHLLVLFSMDQPRLEPLHLTRFLVEAESTGIPVSLALNKSELVAEETLSSWGERLRSWGYKPLFCSVDSRSGLEALVDILKGQTTVIVGPSGVGKSSLINTLRTDQNDLGYGEISRPNERYDGSSKWFGEQRVGPVSKRSGRGTHTTRHVSLLPLSKGGYIADTPGFNQPSLTKVTTKSLAETFPEIRDRLRGSLKRCSFSDCMHLGEPGCAVQADWERYQYYIQLVDEIKTREELHFRKFGTKRESSVRYKTGGKGIRHAEPRLQPKKHRRISRKQLKQSLLDDRDCWPGTYDDVDDDDD